MGGVAVGPDPWCIDLYTDAQGEEAGVSAEDARYLLGALCATSAPLKAFNGIIPEGGNEAGNPTGLLLTATSPASLQVRVEPGRFVSQRSGDSSPYLGGLKAPALLDVTPGHASYDRLDLVVGDPSPDDPPSKVYVVDGEPSDNPVEPELPHDGCVKLGTIPVSAGANTVTQVQPYRVFTSTVGGTRLVWNDQGLDIPGYPGQLRNHDGSIDQWDAPNDQWSVVHGRRLSFTPVMRNYTGAVFSLGNGATIEAWYQFLQRDVAHVSIMVRFGSGVGNLRQQLHFDAPPRATPADLGIGGTGLGQLQSTLFVPSGNINRPDYYFAGVADAFPTGFYPYFPIGAGESWMSFLRTTGPNGTQGTGNPPIGNSSTLFNGVVLTVQGTYRVVPGAAVG